MNTSRISRLGILIAAAIVLHFVESLLPPLFAGIPVKLGLANVFTLFALISMSKTDALCVTLIRCTLGTLISGSVIGIVFSLSGGVLSYIAMCVLLPLYTREKISPVGMSVFGAFFFNLGQLAVGAMLYGKAMLAYFPILSLVSVPTGIFVGILVAILLKSKLFSER